MESFVAILHLWLHFPDTSILQEYVFVISSCWKWIMNDIIRWSTLKALSLGSAVDIKTKVVGWRARKKTFKTRSSVFYSFLMTSWHHTSWRKNCRKRSWIIKEIKHQSLLHPSLIYKCRTKFLGKLIVKLLFTTSKEQAIFIFVDLLGTFSVFSVF